jgi:hypothetical protein
MARGGERALADLRMASGLPYARRMNLKQIRMLHLYLGLLFAPTIIFFSFSGALQIFRLQEAERGSTTQPPRWIVALASVHKDQKVPDPPRPAAAVEASASARPRPAGNAVRAEGVPRTRRKPSLILKWFFTFAAAGLIVSSMLGIVMAFRYNRDRRVIWSLLIAGTLLPIVMLYL